VGGAVGRDHAHERVDHPMLTLIAYDSRSEARSEPHLPQRFDYFMLGSTISSS